MSLKQDRWKTVKPCCGCRGSAAQGYGVGQSHFKIILVILYILERWNEEILFIPSLKDWLLLFNQSVCFLSFSHDHSINPLLTFWNVLHPWNAKNGCTDLRKYLCNGRLGWWLLFLRRWTGGCIPVVGESQSSTSLVRFMQRCCRWVQSVVKPHSGGTIWVLSWSWNSGSALYPHSGPGCFFSFPNAVLWTWRRL